MVLVSAVMRPDLQYQYVIVEQSLTGVTIGEEQPDVPLPLQSPRIPIENALVTVGNLDLSGDTCGSPVQFLETSYDPEIPAEPGIYWAPAGCPTMRPGDQLQLLVETADGSIVRGTTRVPGMNGAFLAVGDDSIPMGGADSAATFNRDRDTLRFGVDAIVGRLLQLDVRRSGDLSDYGTKVQADTTEFLLSGDAVDVYVSGEGNDVFRGGRSYSITLTLSDTNYFDFSRSSNNEFTGRGFINRLAGGMGVFGSAVSATSRVWVVADTDDPREGLYRLTGEIGEVSVDAELRVYLHRQAAVSEVSAFLEGVWFAPGGGGIFDPMWKVKDLAGKSVDGEFVAERLHLVVSDSMPASDLVTYVTLNGLVTTADSFEMVVADSIMFGAAPFDTLIAVRQR
jgi:hypothetical protein